MARTAIYSGRTWRYADVSVVLSLPATIRAGDTPVYYPQVINPDGYTIERVRAVNLSGTALTNWDSDGEPYELTALTAVSEGTEYLVFQIDTTEGGVLTSATIPVTILPSLVALSVGSGTFPVSGNAPVFTGAGTVLTFGAGTFTANAGSGLTLVPAATSISFGAGTFVASAGTGPVLSGTPTTINNSVSVSPNPADYNRDQVTLTCTLNPGSPSPLSVSFYRDYVDATNYGTLIGVGTQQSALVWTYTSYLDYDEYVDVRSVVNNYGTYTPSFNEIDFSVRPLFLGTGTFTANAGTGPTIGVGVPAGSIAFGAGTFTANAGTGPTLTAAGAGITFGAGTFTANAGTGPTLTPAATSITFGAGTFTANAGTGPTLTPAATSITFGAGTFTANAGTGPTLTAASSGSYMKRVLQTLRTGTGTQDFSSGDAGTPDGALFFITKATALNTLADDFMFSQGMTDGTTTASFSAFSDHDTANSVDYTQNNASGTLGAVQGDASQGCVIAFDSFAAGKLTINVTTNDDAEYYCLALLFYDMSNFTVATSTLQQTVGNHNTHNPHDADMVFSMAGRNGALSSGSANVNLSMGIASNEATDRNTCSVIFADDDSTTGNLHHRLYQSGNDIVSIKATAGNQWGAARVDFISGGIEVETTGIDSGSTVVAYAVALMQFNGNSYIHDHDYATPTSTGSNSTGVTSFTPGAVIRLSSASDDGFTQDDLAGWYGISIVDADGNAVSMGAVMDDAAADMNTKSFVNTGLSALAITGDGTTYLSHTFTSFDSDGITENVTTAGSSAARQPTFYLGE